MATQERTTEQRARCRLTSDPLAVRDALCWLRRTLANANLGAEQLDKVEIVAGEALNNIAEHAYSGALGRPVDLSVQWSKAAVTLTLRDAGKAMPEGNLPERRPAPPDPAALQEGGYGWGLIHDLASRLGYRRHGATNILTIEIEAR